MGDEIQTIVIECPNQEKTDSLCLALKKGFFFEYLIPLNKKMILANTNYSQQYKDARSIIFKIKTGFFSIRDWHLKHWGVAKDIQIIKYNLINNKNTIKIKFMSAIFPEIGLKHIQDITSYNIIKPSLSKTVFNYKNDLDDKKCFIDGMSELTQNLIRGDLKKCKKIVKNLKDKSQINNLDLYNIPPLNYLILNISEKKDLNIIKWYLKNSGDPNQFDDKGITPLHLIAENYNFYCNKFTILDESLRLLLFYGADLEQKNNQGESPMDIFMDKDHETYAKFEKILFECPQANEINL